MGQVDFNWPINAIQINAGSKDRRGRGIQMGRVSEMLGGGGVRFL